MRKFRFGFKKISPSFDMRELMKELSQTIEAKIPLAYCSVIETRGSTPQKAGASMLVFGDGNQSGTLGGGCVEADVKRRALHVLNEIDSKPEILSFCLDDDYGWDDGLICGGRMTMLVDPLTANPMGSRISTISSYYAKFRELIEEGLGCTEVVALSNNINQLPVGSRFLFNSRNQPICHLSETTPSKEITDALKDISGRPRPYVQKGYAFLPFLPRITLLIVGGGHVGQGVAKLASEVDFDVWVLDDREKYVSPERFPSATRRLVGDIGQELKKLIANEFHPGIYSIIVTRGHNHDEEALYHLAPTNSGYVGMIGSKRKIKLIYEDLIAKEISEETLAKVHAPLGFDIGSQTVPEIAISIVAELIACRNRPPRNGE
jgi:xanthine dehydrogenase accessory factor